jgi:hypothetical protein
LGETIHLHKTPRATAELSSSPNQCDLPPLVFQRVVMVVAIGFWIKLKQEKKLLPRHFPAGYPAYQKQVKAFVPLLI